MRKDRVAQVVYAIVLIFLLSASMFPSFPYIAEAQDSGLGGAIANDNAVRPIIRHVDRVDKDFNGIQDDLETMISQLTMNASAYLPVVVTLYNPVESQDLDWFVMLGGRVTHVYRYVTYGFAGVIPAANIFTFAGLEKENLCVVEYDAPIEYHLDVSVPLIRARPIVWDTYGYMGSPNQSIAILDTGIDDSHSDVGPFGDLNFSRKIVGWYDATADGAVAPQDYGEHGTHCAGIAAGTGAANSLQTSGFVTNTLTDSLSGLRSGWGYLYYGFDVMNPGLITLTCSWTSSNTLVVQLRDVTGNTVLADVRGKQKPLVLTYNAAQSGRYRPFVGIGGVGEKGSGYFSLRENYPYQGRNDDHNLFTGVAPNSKLVGVKVFNNTGSGTSSTVMAGMDWVIQNRLTYHIVVASMSLGLEYGATNSTIDQKVDTMVENGIVTCVSAGNDFPTYTIGSPGTAAYVITVGATNDQNWVTSYSSNGDVAKNEFGLVKPDVVAPGGGTGAGNLIISADSNDMDYGYSGQSDYTLNDYQQFGGTSMSAPHVAGLAALMTDALSSWSWTKDEVFKLKMIISMTSFETQSGEGSNIPPLNRGEKDSKEGYGRICADAAIEALTMTYNVGETASDVFGSGPSDKKVWARQVSLLPQHRYEFHLSVPAGADYDLYLYNGTSDSYGQPVILGKSVNATVGAEEIISYTSVNSGNAYLVVKWVSGSGSFNLQSTSTSAIVHDVAVVNVEPTATKAYVGWLVNITVVVRNDGGAGENFTVSAYYDTNLIGTQNITSMVPDATENITFIWNTTNVTPCFNYTIKAEASAVPGEIDIADNTYIDGAVKVNMMGDINGDRLIDISDLATVAWSFYTKPGDPNWNPDADLNQDKRIDVVDLTLVAIHYLQTC